MSASAPTRPLDGRKVVDLTIWVQGGVAAELLADLGASVLKIERPEHGDFSRGLTSFYGAAMRTDDGRNLLWELCNRNKRSLALDLRADEGQAILRRLVAEADVFVTNFQPSTLERLGALPSQLLEANPALVYALGSGLGRRGAFADAPGQDTVGMAYSGFMDTASPNDEPVYAPGAIADVLAGTNLAFGVLAALLARERDGRGRLVTTSLLQSMMWAQSLNVGVPANGSSRLDRFDRTRVANPLVNLYRCGDGRWIALGMVTIRADTWRLLCEALGRPEWQDDERFATRRSLGRNAREAIRVLDRAFAERPAAEWLARLRAAGLSSAPVNRAEELAEDPAVVEEGLLARTARGLRFVRSPFTIEGTEIADGDAPALGADGFAALRELGLPDEEIADLARRGVLG
jgi:crotonobetainyl-CoA:carnitine CoA-transferase CaiB-like acyl-CoA transferase